MGMLYDMCEQLKFGNETTTGGRHDERHCRRRRVGEGEGDDVSGGGGEGVKVILPSLEHRGTNVVTIPMLGCL